MARKMRLIGREAFINIFDFGKRRLVRKDGREKPARLRGFGPPAYHRRAILLFRFFIEKPIPQVLGHDLKPIVANPLLGVCRHAAVTMAHHQLDSWEIAGFLGNGQECVSQRID
jgi:hypothetical protein